MRSDDLTLNAALPDLTAASCLRLLSCNKRSLAAAEKACQRLQELAPTLEACTSY